MQTSARRMGRRGFVITSVLGGSALMLGFSLRPSGTRTRAPQTGGVFAPNAFLRITADGRITLISKQMEVGQGVKTALPMLLAEELEADWTQVVVEQGDFDAAYGNQFAGASTSVLKNYEPLRLLGATARTLLVTAAAQTWGVPERECQASRSQVQHTPTGRSLGYGELAAKAATLELPSERSVRLKDPRNFTLIGQRIGGVDNTKIVRGEPLYGLDLQLPGMLHASVARCPVFGGRVAEANLAEIKALPGVADAFVIDGGTGLHGVMPGVAIVAESTWAALRARQHLKVRWTEGDTSRTNWTDLSAQAKAASAQPGTALQETGDAPRALAAAATRIDATYTYPFVCHAAMEPLNCTASLQDGTLTLWAGSQAPAWAVDHVHQALGIPKDRIRLHLLRSGGGFGRRLSTDFIVEAATVAQRVAAPVKLMWTREDDLQHDHFRPGGVHALKAGLDATGRLVAWHDHSVTFGHGGVQPAAPFDAKGFPTGQVAHCRAAQTVIDCRIPTGAWRAPGANAHAWAIQCFIDELALAAGRDPLAFRLALLDGGGFDLRALLSRRQGFDAPRMRRVLEAVAQKSGWGKKLPRGQGQGIAFQASYGGYAAHVAEVSVSPEGRLAIERVVCVCDVGEQIVNLSGAEQQVQGAILDGLSAAWFQSMDIQGGRAVQSNFHDYRLLRMHEAPARIEVHFLRSEHPSSGLGEPALPSLAPAVCNAIFQASGHRIRELPIARQSLAWQDAKAS